MKRITVIMGAYGSGKSEFCSQLALKYAPCAIADMDILNPYFRVREIHEKLARNNVEVISSILGHQTNQDIPAVSGAIGHYIINDDARLIVDLAGSENGLKALRLFDDLIKTQENDVLLVINPYRIEMGNDDLMEMIARFQSISNLSLTGIVNNSNLLDQTSWEDIVAGWEMVHRISVQTNLPIRYTMLDAKFIPLFDLDDSEIIEVKQWMLREEWMGDKYA